MPTPGHQNLQALPGVWGREARRQFLFSLQAETSSEWLSIIRRLSAHTFAGMFA